MKTHKIKVLTISIIWSLGIAAQTEPDTRKYIEVTGSAEMSVMPDEIQLEIVMCEYNKQGLDKAEENFMNLLKENNITKEAIIIQSQELNWWYYWQYKHEQQRTRTMKLKLNKNTDLMKFAKGLHAPWVQSVRVSSYSNGETPRFRKEVKIEAIKAAKDKAAYLLEAVGEKLGGLLCVVEMPENSPNPWYAYQSNSNVMSNSYIGSSGSDNGMGNVAEIRLRYEVKAKFEIK